MPDQADSHPNLKIVYSPKEFAMRSVRDLPGLLMLSFRPEHDRASWCIDSRSAPPGTEGPAPKGLTPKVVDLDADEDTSAWLTAISPEELVGALDSLKQAIQILGMMAESVKVLAHNAGVGQAEWLAVASGALLADKTGELIAERWAEETRQHD